MPCSYSGVPDSYIAALQSEALFYAKKYAVHSWKTVYVGGGTPSLLTPEQILRLFKGIAMAAPFASGAEVTVEMNPDDITPQLLCAAETAGVNRLSVGIQSLNNAVLLEISRRCTRKTSLSALEIIQKNWNHSFSADIISGLPEASSEYFVETLQTLVSFNPDHISLYALTLEEETPLGSQILSGKKFYDYDAADAQWVSGRNYLKSRGYGQYEVSNFSKPGFESVHNKTYWHLENYIGIGAGASGSVYSELGKDKNGIRWTNSKDISLYIDFWKKNCLTEDVNLPRITEVLSPKTQEFEFLMMGLRLLEGVSSSEYAKRFKKSLAERLGDIPGGLFDSWQKKNLACCYEKPSGKYYALTEPGILFLNSFLESLL